MRDIGKVHIVVDVDGTIQDSGSTKYNDALLTAIQQAGATEVTFATSMSVRELLNFEGSDRDTKSVYPRSQMVKDLPTLYSLTVKDIVMTADGATIPGIKAGFMYQVYYQPIASAMDAGKKLNVSAVADAEAHLKDHFKLNDKGKTNQVLGENATELQNNIRAVLVQI